MSPVDPMAALERLYRAACGSVGENADGAYHVLRDALQAQQPTHDGDDWVASNEARNIIIGQGSPFAHVKAWCDSSGYAERNSLRPVRLSTLREAEPTPDGERERLLDIVGEEVDPAVELERLASDCDVAAASALEEGAKLRCEVSECVTPHAEVDATLAAAREWDGTYHDMRKIALIIRRYAALLREAQQPDAAE